MIYRSTAIKFAPHRDFPYCRIFTGNKMTKINKNIEDVKKKEADLRNALNIISDDKLSLENTPSTLIKRKSSDGLKEEIFSKPVPAGPLPDEGIEVAEIKVFLDKLDKEKISLLYSKLIEYKADLQGCGLIDALKPSNTVEFKNESPFDFTDISSEEYRIYEFNNGKTVMITEPLKLSVSKSGGHRIYDNAGISHYIPQGWLHLSWRSKPGKPNFVK
jgi:hypothetical protein